MDRTFQIAGTSAYETKAGENFGAGLLVHEGGAAAHPAKEARAPQLFDANLSVREVLDTPKGLCTGAAVKDRIAALLAGVSGTVLLFVLSFVNLA